MDRDTINYIDSLTDEIYKVCNITTPLDNLSSLIDTLGGELVTRLNPNSKREPRYEDKYDGVLKVKDSWYEGTPVFKIRVLGYKSGKTEIARLNKVNVLIQLGYLFLHLGYKIDYTLWLNQESGKYLNLYTGARYEQAKYFALSLLMPKSEYLASIDRHIKNNGISDGVNRIDIAKVAEDFNVHISSAILRGVILGVLAQP